MFRQVPVLPVVVPLAAVVLAVLLRVLRRRDRWGAPRVAVAVALSVYAAGVVANTVFPVYLDKPRADVPWSEYLVLDPSTGYEVTDAVTNVLVFVPLGALLALVLTRPSWPRVVAAVTAASLTIEVTQYVTAHLLGGGHVADVHDLLFDVAGGALGLGLLLLAARVPGLAGFVDRFRWQRVEVPAH
ncbi:VanZ family protein [Klenkia sp. PcliD-1-E]|uniref:VanZ family protein n=1 Tax=Klenkia sp. PcliD-1-E TaxID=2954492 RepID=UPI0020972DD9|nr:VanZ family protein [Klenkia sp. PcliD-1-E]MCO7220581.1 VanZ family protein [Klenkia sp. PcliD-1-E]